MADEQLTADDIGVLLAALVSHSNVNTPGLVTRRIATLADKLRNMRASAPVPKLYMMITMLTHSGQGGAQVCTRCGSVVPDTNEWRMLHDEWHKAVALREAEA